MVSIFTRIDNSWLGKPTESGKFLVTTIKIWKISSVYSTDQIPMENCDKPIIFKLFKDFGNHKRNTNRALVFSCKPLPTIPTYKNHKEDLPTFRKTWFLQTHIEIDYLVYICNWFWTKKLFKLHWVKD